MRPLLLLLAAPGLAAAIGAPAPPAPGRPTQPRTEVGGYPIRIERVDEYQEAALDLSGPPEQPGRFSATHRVGFELRVGAAGPAAAALDRIEGPLRIETDRGQKVDVPSAGFAVGRDGGLLAVDTDDVDLSTRSIRALRGTLRAFPKGETFRLPVAGKVGAEARHPSGLLVQVKRFLLRDGRASIELAASWPAQVSPRGADEGEGFSVGVEGPNFAHEPIPSSRETIEAPANGRTATRIETELGGLRGPVETIVLEGVLLLGKPLLYPFVLRDIPLPLPLSQPAAGAPAAGTAAQQRVLINGRPAGRGLIELGVSTWTGGAWGPWRWSRVPTDDAGIGSAALPGPGRYRLQRRWTPLAAGDVKRLSGARWQGELVEVVVAAGKPVVVPPLAAAVAPATESTGAPVGYRVTVPAGSGTFTIRATRVRQIGRALLSFGRDGVPQPSRPSRLVFLNLEVTAADPRWMTGLSGVGVSGGVASDDSPLELPTDPQSPTMPTADQPMQLTVAFLRVRPEWTDLREVVGELAVCDRSLAETLDIPLTDAAAVDFRRDDLRLRIDIGKQQSMWRYRIELRSPEGGSMLIPRERRESPLLLDADRKPLPQAMLGVESRSDFPTVAVVSFSPPAAEDAPAPAFLRVPLRARFGEPRSYSFRLTAIPLPLAPR